MNFALKASAFAIVLLLTSSCSRLRPKSSDPVIAEIGPWTVRQSDIRLRKQLLEITEGGRVVEDGIVLSHLLRAFVAAEILAKYNHPVTTDVLEQEAARIDASTLAPDVLAQIKAVFGDRRKDYLEDYVLPIYVGRVLPYDVVRWDKGIQANVRADAEQWLKSVRDKPQSFVQEAESLRNREPDWVEVSNEEGWQRIDPERQSARLKSWEQPPDVSPKIATELARQEEQRKEEMEGWVRDLLDRRLSDVKVGNVLPDVLELPEVFLVARLHKKKSDRYLLRVVGFPKKVYDEFYWEAAAHVPVMIHHGVMRDEMIRLVPWSARFSFATP